MTYREFDVEIWEEGDYLFPEVVEIRFSFIRVSMGSEISDDISVCSTFL